MIHADKPTMVPIKARSTDMARTAYMQPRGRADWFTFPRILRSVSPISICAAIVDKHGVCVAPYFLKIRRNRTNFIRLTSLQI